VGKTLVVGYGNLDREDDGVAWHVLVRLAEGLGLPPPAQDSDGLPQVDDQPDLLCLLQLDPGLAEVIAGYDRVCFVDAHTGAYPQDIRFAHIEGQFQASPFTHHMTPETCLALAQTLHGCVPNGMVLSVKGHQFGFSNTLSPATAELAEQATQVLIGWLASQE